MWSFLIAFAEKKPHFRSLIIQAGVRVSFVTNHSCLEPSGGVRMVAIQLFGADPSAFSSVHKKVRSKGK